MFGDLLGERATLTQPDAAGFSVLPGVLLEERADALSAHLAEAAIPRSRAGARNALSDPAVRMLANEKELVRIASEALGGEAFPFRATFFDKSRRNNWLVVWHQDTALPIRARRDVPGWGPWSTKAGVLYAHAPAEALARVIALRVHLDDSTADNGPLRVLPGTHLLGVLTDERIHELSRTIPPVHCMVARGGIVTMRPLVVHASSKSAGPQPRRVLHIEYATSRQMGDGVELGVAEQGVEADEA